MQVTLSLEDISAVIAEAVAKSTAELRAEIGELRSLVDDSVALVEDFHQKDIAAQLSTESIGAHVRAHLIDALEEMELPAGPPGPPGPAGPEGPAGRDGVDGWNGQDGAPGDKGDPGVDGKDGKPGLDGQKGDPGMDGKDGTHGIDGKDGLNGIDGKDGAPGPEGQKGIDGADGIHGQDGKDGVGVAGAVIDRDGELVLTLSDGATQKLGCVVGRDGAPGMDGKDGAPGMDGKDGLGFDDYEFKRVGKRDFLLTLVQGERRKEFPMRFDIPLDAGVWSSGQTYEAGDMVTRGGSMWIAQEPTSDEPGAGATRWRLCVKRGSNGKDGKDGKPGERGPEGKQGRDLTQMGTDGSKW